MGSILAIGGSALIGLHAQAKGTKQPVFAGGSIAPEPRPTARRATMTLALACGSVAILASAPPVHAGRAELVSASAAEQYRDIGIAPLGQGGATGAQAAPAGVVIALLERPVRPAGMTAALAAPVVVPTVTLRLRGRVGDGLYGSLLATGLAPHAASAYLKILSGQRGVGSDIGADDHFDLVIASRGAAPPDQPIEGSLLYAAIDRVGASDVRVMKWPVGGTAQWLDAGATEQRAGSLGQPVAGRLSSGFGIRRHPILGFARSHRGVDYAARWGQPIIAAADGQVVRSGWAGAYGRQVRIVHGAGLATSYSHMSRTAVGSGAHVRAGQIIGYVGSSGLSTGPHLHYEVHRGGVAVNPLGVRFAGAARIQGPQADAFRARLAQFLTMAPQRPS